MEIKKSVKYFDVTSFGIYFEWIYFVVFGTFTIWKGFYEVEFKN